MSRLRVIVGSVVTGVWAIGYVWSFIDRDVKAPAEATPIMLGVVAYLFAREIKSVVRRGDEPE